MTQREKSYDTNRVTRAPRAQRFTLVLASAVLVLGILYVHSTPGVPAHEIELVYFNEDGQTVGGSIMTCNSGYHPWGVTTDFYAELITSCNPSTNGGSCSCTYQGSTHPCPTSFDCSSGGGL